MRLLFLFLYFTTIGWLIWLVKLPFIFLSRRKVYKLTDEEKLQEASELMNKSEFDKARHILKGMKGNPRAEELMEYLQRAEKPYKKLQKSIQKTKKLEKKLAKKGVKVNVRTSGFKVNKK